MTKLTNKTISQETVILEDVVADVVADKVLCESYKDAPIKWESMSKQERLDFDAKYKSDKESLVNHLVERANTTYQHNAEFNKILKSKTNKGRDTLYAFMYDWSGIGNGGKVVVPFKEMIEKYSKEKDLYEKFK